MFRFITPIAEIRDISHLPPKAIEIPQCKKNKFFIGDECTTSDPLVLQNLLNVATEKLTLKNREIKLLHQKVRCFEKKMKTLESLFGSAFAAQKSDV